LIIIYPCTLGANAPSTDRIAQSKINQTIMNLKIELEKQRLQ
jgi:hypothetical protein